MGGALLLCPAHSRAEPYTLLYSLVPPAQGFSKVVEHPSNLWLWIWWGTH